MNFGQSYHQYLKVKTANISLHLERVEAALTRAEEVNPHNTFVHSMRAAYTKYGNLTYKQVAALNNVLPPRVPIIHGADWPGEPEGWDTPWYEDFVIDPGD